MMKVMLNYLTRSFLVKKHFDELEHTTFVTECTSNMDESAYKEHSEK